MKRFLTLTALFFNLTLFCQQEDSKLVVVPQTYVLTGSILCENLNQIYNLPDSLRAGYQFDIEINADLENNELNISYTGQSSLFKLYRESLSTGLNSYFLEPDFTSKLDTWKIITSVYIEEKLIDRDTLPIFNPYRDCYLVKSNCDSITIDLYSIENEILCTQAFDYNLLSLLRKSDSTIFVRKMDIVIPANCLIGTKHIQKSSLNFKELTNSNYKIYDQKEIYTTTCNGDICISPLLVTLNQIGEANLSNCIINGISEINKVFYVFPNPSSGSVYIQNYIGKIQIINTFGETKEIEGNEVFNLETFKSGIYFLQFLLNGEIRREKIILE